MGSVSGETHRPTGRRGATIRPRPATRQPARSPRGLYRRSYLFSEGFPLHLWQIRHFRINAQSLRKLTGRIVASAPRASAQSAGPERRLRLRDSCCLLSMTLVVLAVITPSATFAQADKSISANAEDYVRRAHLAL